MDDHTYVITGGPCTGKTTLCAALERRGYPIVPEAARAIIAEEREKERGTLPWTNLPGFQELVYERQLRNERFGAGRLRFCDRGLVDNLGYCAAGGISPPAGLAGIVETHTYAGVFVLEPVPAYETDLERVEDPTEGIRLHRHIVDAYKRVGYTPIHVPAFEYLQKDEAVAMRASYVLSMIEARPRDRLPPAAAQLGVAA